MYGCGLFAEFYKPSKPQMHLSEIRMGYSKKKILDCQINSIATKLFVYDKLLDNSF